MAHILTWDKAYRINLKIFIGTCVETPNESVFDAKRSYFTGNLGTCYNYTFHMLPTYLYIQCC